MCRCCLGTEAETCDQEMFNAPSGVVCLNSLFGLILGSAPELRADSAQEINRESRAALQKLYSTVPAARRAGDSATAVLVFPSIVKAGFVVGGQRGEGTLFPVARLLDTTRPPPLPLVCRPEFKNSVTPCFS